MLTPFSEVPRFSSLLMAGYASKSTVKDDTLDDETRRQLGLSSATTSPDASRDSPDTSASGTATDDSSPAKKSLTSDDDTARRKEHGWPLTDISVPGLQQLFHRFADNTGCICITGEFTTIAGRLVGVTSPTLLITHDFDGSPLASPLDFSKPETITMFGGLDPAYKIRHALISDNGYLLLYLVKGGKVYRAEQFLLPSLRLEIPDINDFLSAAGTTLLEHGKVWQSQMPPSAYLGMISLLHLFSNPAEIVTSIFREFENDWLHAFYYLLDCASSYSMKTTQALGFLKFEPCVTYLMGCNEINHLERVSEANKLRILITAQRDKDIQQMQQQSRKQSKKPVPSSPITDLTSKASSLTLSGQTSTNQPDRSKVSKKLDFNKRGTMPKGYKIPVSTKTYRGLDIPPKKPPAPKEDAPFDSGEEESKMKVYSDFLSNGTRPLADHRTVRLATELETSYAQMLRKLIQELSLGTSLDDLEMLRPDLIDLATNGKDYPSIKRYYDDIINKRTVGKAAIFQSVGSGNKGCWIVANLLFMAERAPDHGDRRAADFALKNCINSTFDLEQTKADMKIVYTIPTFNRFDGLAEDDISLESGDLSADLMAVYMCPEIRKTGYTVSHRAGPIRSSHVAGTIDRLNDLKKKRTERELRQVNDAPSPGKVDKIKRVQAAIERMKKKVDNLIKEGDLGVAKYVLTHGVIGSYILGRLYAEFPWLSSPMDAKKKGLVYWMAYSKHARLPKYIALAGLVHEQYTRGRSAGSEGGWIKDLTGDGDIEANPGPVLVQKMDEIKTAIDFQKLFKARPDVTWPLQHWAHHRLSAYGGDYSKHFGELSNQIVCHLNVQNPDSSIQRDVAIPLRETHLYPRTFALAEDDGGVRLEGQQIIHIRVLPRGAPGFTFPGQRQYVLPHDNDDDPIIYCDRDDVALNPQPLLDNGEVDRRALQPAYFGRVPLQVTLELGREETDWEDDPANPEVFNALWDFFDLADGINMEPGARYDIPMEGVRPWGDPIYRMTSGVPIFFVATDRYNDPNVPPLDRSEYAEAIYSQVGTCTTTLSHRPEPLIKGYRKTDVDMYVLNFIGIDADMTSTTALGGNHRLKLDMTSFNAKLGHYAAWWSLVNRENYHGISIAGQTQVTTPWVSVDPQERFIKVINDSPNAWENCGGWNQPGFPFAAVRQNQVVTGTIHFHLSFATIPPDKAVLWIPAAWHSPQYMPTIALMIMCLAPYPMGNFGVWLNTVDSISGQESSSYYNWIPGMTSIPGDTDFHVIWPRRSPAMTRAADRLEDIQGLASFAPFSGPTAAGGTAANTRYQVSGDFNIGAQRAPPANLVEFCLSWINHISEADLRNLTEKLAIAGVYANSWHVIYDSLVLWSTRTSTLTVSAEGPLGVPDIEQRRRLLANDEAHLKTIHLHGNDIPRLEPEANWLNVIPEEYDAHVMPTLTEALGAVLGGFAVGKGNKANHDSVLWSTYSSTWLPMAILGFRAVACACDAMAMAYKITPDLFQHRYDNNGVFQHLAYVYDNIYPSSKIKDPRFLDAVDFIMAAAMQGSCLRLCDNKRNLLRTITVPRSMTGTVYSQDYVTLYSGIVPVKYPDIYYATVSDSIIMDWAPFPVINAGLSACGITSSNGSLCEVAHLNFAGPSINTHGCPLQPRVSDILYFDGMSHWNSRMLLIGAHSNLYQYPSGMLEPGFTPMGQLVVLRKWARDRVLRDNQHVNVWSWCNTNYFPLYRWNCRELLVLNVADVGHIRETRAIQTGAESQPFYAWLVANFFPVPLRSDANEKPHPGTSDFMGMFKRVEESKSTSIDNPLDTSVMVVGSDGSGNAKEEVAKEPPSGAVSSTA